MRLKSVIFGALAFGSGWFGHLATEATAAPQERGPYAMVGQMGRVLALIENEYVDPVDRTRLVEGAIKGMVSELDPHSAFMPPQDFSIFQSDTEGQFGGVGVEVDLRGETVTVLTPIEGSPADKAGIKSGDKIVAVDGEDARVIGIDKMIRKMRGAPNTHVKLSIHRDGEKELRTFDLVREIIKVASVTGKMLDGGIGYVRIKQFQERTHEEMLKTIGKIRQSGAIKGAILDLRSNPGGLVDEASEVADEMLADGTIYTARHRGIITDKVDARGGGALADVPIVVLVNEWSASASELVAGALQDHKRATIVGTNTFGKGSVQTILELPNNAGIRITTARYYTPFGHAIQADGVHPDVQIDNSKITKSNLPQLREKDLENALPPEGAPGSDAGVVYVAPAVDGGTDESLAVRNMPSDPSKGNDFVLKVGYEILRKMR
jgi:carboxyl-terminal processing protease